MNTLLLIHRLEYFLSLVYHNSNGNTKLKEIGIKTCQSIYLMLLEWEQMDHNSNLWGGRDCQIVSICPSQFYHSALKASVPSMWITTVGFLDSSGVQPMERLLLLLTSFLQDYLMVSRSLQEVHYSSITAFSTDFRLMYSGDHFSLLFLWLFQGLQQLRFFVAYPYPTVSYDVLKLCKQSLQ